MTLIVDGIEATRETRTAGADLRIGDIIDTWAGLDTITGFRPYVSPMAHIFEHGARIAVMARNPRGALVSNDGLFEVSSRALQPV